MSLDAPSTDRLADLLGEALTTARQGCASRHQMARAGVTRRRLERALRDGRLVRLRRSVYAQAQLPARARHLVSGGRPDPTYLAQVRAVLLSLGDTSAACGRTAAVLWGFDQFVEPARIEVAVPTSRTRVSMQGVDARVMRHLDAVEHPVGDLEPIRLTSPVATVLDCGLTRPLQEAVVIADSALRSGQVTVEELVEGVTLRAGMPGVHRLRTVLELVDPASGSVLESLFRVLMVTNGLHPQSQVVLRRNGRMIGRVDFLFADHGLVVECDGRRWHDPEDVRQADRRRDNEVARLGFRIIRVSWADVVHAPQEVVALVRDCLQAQAAAA